MAESCETILIIDDEEIILESIGNYLEDNPLLAGPESKFYRLKKFVKKVSIFNALWTLSIGEYSLAYQNFNPLCCF